MCISFSIYYPLSIVQPICFLDPITKDRTPPIHDDDDEDAFGTRPLYTSVTLQLISYFASAGGKIRHRHNLNNQAGPACEMLRALAGASLRVVLLPCETSLFPALEHGLDEVLAQFRIQFRCLFLMGTFGLREIL